MQSPDHAQGPTVELTALGGAPRPRSEARAVSAIVALSDDPVLLRALEGATRENAVVIISPSADRFIDQLVANAASVALIDASSAPSPLPAFISLLREQFPTLLLILAGPAQLQHQFAAQIGDGTVFRFAHKPASSQRLQLFIDAALRQRESTVAPQKPVARAVAASPPARVGLGVATGLAIVLVAALVTAGILYALRAHAPTP